MCDLQTQMADKVENLSTWNQHQEQLQEHILYGQYHKFLSDILLDYYLVSTLTNWTTKLGRWFHLVDCLDLADILSVTDQVY